MLRIVGGHQRNGVPAGTTVTWEGFLRTISGKYFSDCARDKKVVGFMQLSQKDLTVDQYEVKFAELSRVAPRMVENREDQAKRFLNGLRTNIRRQLMDYNELYERA